MSNHILGNFKKLLEQIEETPCSECPFHRFCSEDSLLHMHHNVIDINEEREYSVCEVIDMILKDVER